MLIKDEHHLFRLHAVAAKAASLQTARRQGILPRQKPEATD